MAGRNEFLKRTPAQEREDRVRRLQAAIRDMEEHDPELLDNMEIGAAARRLVGSWTPKYDSTRITRMIKCDSSYTFEPGDTAGGVLGEIAQSMPYAAEVRAAIGDIVFQTASGEIFKVYISTVLVPLEPDDPRAKDES
jgi:hypothetical protein